MALQAHGIAPHRVQFRRIQHRRLPLRPHVLAGIAVARRTSDPAMRKWRMRKMIPRPRQRCRHAAHMAMQTVRIHRQGQRHLARLQIIRRHIPHALLRIPVHRRLKPIPIAFKQICPSARIRADEISELNLAIQISARRRSRPRITQPARAISFEDAVGDTGGLMRKAPHDQSIHRRTARPCHRRRFVLFINFAVAPRAYRVRRA